MTGNENIQQEVTKLIDSAAARAFAMSLEDIIPEFNKIKDECLSKVYEDKLKKEIVQRINEWVMKIYCDRDEEFEKVKNTFENVDIYNYIDIESKANLVVYFSQYCIRNNNLVEAKKHLNKLVLILNTSSSPNSSNIIDYYKGVCANLLKEEIGIEDIHK